MIAMTLLNGPLLSVALRLTGWSALHEFAWAGTVGMLVLASFLAIWFQGLQHIAIGVASVLLVAVEAKVVLFGAIAAAYSTGSLPQHFHVWYSLAFVSALITAAGLYLDSPRKVILLNALLLGLAIVVSAALWVLAGMRGVA